MAYTPVLLKGTKIEGFYDVPEIKALISSNLTTSLDQVIDKIIPLDKSILWYTRAAYSLASIMMTAGLFIF